MEKRWSFCTWCCTKMCRKLSCCHRFNTLPCVMQRQVSKFREFRNCGSSSKCNTTIGWSILLSWCIGLFPPFSSQKRSLSPSESFVMKQIACSVRNVLCELRHGRKPRSMSSLLHYLLVSLFFWNILSEKILLFWISFPFYCPTFQHKETLSFLWTECEHNISFFVVKNIFVCALCCSNLFFGFSFSFIFQKQNKFPHFIVSKKKKTFSFYFFVIVVEKKNSWFCKKKTFVSFWFTSLFAHSCLFCGRSDTDIGRGSSVAASRLISFLVSSSSCFQSFLFFYDRVFLRFLFLFFILCSLL